MQGGIQFHVCGGAAMLLPRLAPCMVDHDPPHQLGGDREEVPAILPGHIALSHQFHVSLVQDDCRLQAAVPPLAREMARGECVEAGRYSEGDEAVECLATSVLPLLQQPGDIVARRGRVAHLGRRGQ